MIHVKFRDITPSESHNLHTDMLCNTSTVHLQLELNTDDVISCDCIHALLCMDIADIALSTLHQYRALLTITVHTNHSLVHCT